jgi:isopentenyl-diphosphate delta-isomerase
MDVEKVILVDEADREIGEMEKLEAHQRGLRHRAFSIFIFNRMGEMLLQQRAFTKYHSPGLWSNACCGHPRPGENLEQATTRRLQEELGFETDLEYVFHFSYRTEFENGLVENEIDHVYFGIYNGAILFNTTEANAVEFAPMDEIEKRMEKNPGEFTVWFREALPMLKKWQSQLKK